MKNLIDRAKTLDKRILHEEISKMQVFRVSGYLKMLLFNLYYLVIKALGKVSENLREKSRGLKIKTFDSLINDELDSLDKYKNGMDRLISNIRFHTAQSFSFSGSTDDSDSLSTSVTKSAANIFGKSELKGRSVYEINDLIYRRYSDKIKYDCPFYLRIFAGILFGSLSLTVLFCIISPYKLKNHLLIFAVILAVILALSYILIQRSISVLLMARLVWVIMAETDPGEKDFASVNSLNEDELHLLELRMRALHSLIHSSDVLGNEISVLQTEKDSFSGQLNRNNDSINLLLRENSDEAKRTVHIKAEENEELRKKIKDNEQKILNKEGTKKKVDSLISELFKSLIPTIRKKWGSLYSRLELSDDVIHKFLKYFSYSDLPMVEKRMTEIEKTKNPVAISKRSGNSYILELSTYDGGLALISFLDTKSSGKIEINDFLRKTDISEPSVTNAELSEALKGLNKHMIDDYEKELNDLQNKYVDDLKKWDSEKRNLQEKNRKLEQKKQTLEKSITKKQAELDDLSKKLEKKEAEQKNLLSQLERITEQYDPQRYNALRSELDTLNRELGSLKKDYENRLEELDRLYLEVDALNTENEELKKNLDKMKETLQSVDSDARKYAELYRKNEDRIKKLNDEIEKKDSDIAVFKGLVEKSEKAKGVDPNTVNKLKSKIETLKREKGELKKALKKSEDESGSLQKILEQTQNDLENMRAEAEDLASRRSYILYDREIYEELYKWIAKAKSYIYIIAPFTGYDQIKKMKDEFLRATGKNKRLNIKILYGIQDRDKYGALSEKDRIKLNRSKKRIAELKTALGSNFKAKETNTHCKVIICDDEKFMIGSANVLSFQGNYKEDNDVTDELRHEVALVSEDRANLLELKARYFGW